MHDLELIEAMARTMYERFVPPDPWWDGEDDDVHSFWTSRAEAALQAALAYRPDCPTCGGVGSGTGDGWVAEVVCETPLQLRDISCPSCNGSGKGLPALIRREELEQVEHWELIRLRDAEDYEYVHVDRDDAPTGDPDYDGDEFLGSEPIYCLRPESEGAAE